MPRYALKLEYDGRPFVGWQRQHGQSSVQQTVEMALQKLEPDCGPIFGAGRTDAGVHASGQVAHVDLLQPWTEFRLSEALNHHLSPAPVAAVAVAKVNDEFHARFSALERRYIYRVLFRRAPLTLEKGQAWRVTVPLDRVAMQQGANYLLGEHDFTTFRSTMCQAASPVKTLDQLDIAEINHKNAVEYRFSIRARSFLHNQVRSFVGTLQRVGTGAWPPERIEQALLARDRAACGPVCPAYGLYLAEVIYAVNPFAGSAA